MNIKELFTLIGNNFIRKKRLWKNTSPSSAFVAQTLLNSTIMSSYDEFEMVVRNAASSGNLTDYSTCQSIFIKKGSSNLLRLIANVASGGTPTIIVRQCNVTSSGIEIQGGAYKGFTSSSFASSDSMFIPLEIYGIKNILGGRLSKLIFGIFKRGCRA